jgi:hypothetical protein
MKAFIVGIVGIVLLSAAVNVIPVVGDWMNTKSDQRVLYIVWRDNPNGTWVRGVKSIYTINVEHQRVLRHGVLADGTALQVEKLDKCRVVDADNWTCSYGMLDQGDWAFTNGEPAGDLAPNAVLHYVSALEWHNTSPNREK